MVSFVVRPRLVPPCPLTDSQADRSSWPCAMVAGYKKTILLFLQGFDEYSKQTSWLLSMRLAGQ